MTAPIPGPPIIPNTVVDGTTIQAATTSHATPPGGGSSAAPTPGAERAEVMRPQWEMAPNSTPGPGHAPDEAREATPIETARPPWERDTKQAATVAALEAETAAKAGATGRPASP